MKTATILIHLFTFGACFAAYVGSDGTVPLNGVRRAMQTIAATTDPAAGQGFQNETADDIA